MRREGPSQQRETDKEGNLLTQGILQKGPGMEASGNLQRQRQGHGPGLWEVWAPTPVLYPWEPSGPQADLQQVEGGSGDKCKALGGLGVGKRSP